MKNKCSLDIVIVNWNSKEQLFQCLKSLEEAHKSLEIEAVIVIDNASEDASFDNIETLSIPLITVKNSYNVGFSSACNQGAKLGKANYILFLNPDTKVSAQSLLLPLEFMHTEGKKIPTRIGICGVKLTDESGVTTPSCSRFPSSQRIFATMLGLRLIFPSKIKKELMTDWDHSTSEIVDQIKGAFFLVDRNLFDDLSGFDERFFVYYEEVDFSYRAKASGWDSYFLATTQIYHRGCGTTDSVKGKALFYFLRSRILYIYKHFTYAEGIIHTVGTLSIELIARVARSLFRGSWSEFLGTLQAYAYLYQWLLLKKDNRWSV
jgi:N-acetylglucosaminyl-diphospho-decaprenol L-rhamnosyltransferase